MENAKPIIKEIFQKGTLATPDETAIEKNTTILKMWICQKVFNEFEEKIGFSQETDDADLWPALTVLNIITKKIELMSPGLTQRKVGDKIMPLPIKKALERRFGEERTKKREEFKCSPKNKGKKSFNYYFYACRASRIVQV